MNKACFDELVREALAQGNMFLRYERRGVPTLPHHLLKALLKLVDGAERVYYRHPDLRRPCGRIRKSAQKCREVLDLLAKRNGDGELLFAAMERRLSGIDFHAGKIALS